MMKYITAYARYEPGELVAIADNNNLYSGIFRIASIAVQFGEGDAKQIYYNVRNADNGSTPSAVPEDRVYNQADLERLETELTEILQYISPRARSSMELAYQHIQNTLTRVESILIKMERKVKDAAAT